MFIFPNNTDLNKEIEDLNLVSKNYLLYSVNSDEILAYKNHQKQLPVASIIKILTTMTIIEMLGDTDLDTIFEVDPLVFEYLDPTASTAGLYAGQELSIMEGLYAIMLPSGGDSIMNFSLYLTGKPDGLLKPMQDLADKIGMENTQVKNMLGLDQKGHLTTLEDILKLLLYSRENQTFMRLYTKSDHYFEFNPEMYIYNYILKNAEDIEYNTLYGAKSGFTDTAENSLTSFAREGDVEYIFISTQAGGSPYSDDSDAFHDAVKVYTYLYDNFDKIEVPENSLKTQKIKIKGRFSPYTYNNSEAYELLIANDFDQALLKSEITVEPKLKAPVKKGDKLGVESIYYDDILISTEDIFAEEKISSGILYPSLKVGSIVGLLALGYIIIRKRRR